MKLIGYDLAAAILRILFPLHFTQVHARRPSNDELDETLHLPILRGVIKALALADYPSGFK